MSNELAIGQLGTVGDLDCLPKSNWKSVVLVGGQSLTAWVECYKIKLPAFESPYLAIDADFLGTKTEAEVIARELNHFPLDASEVTA